MPVGIRCDSGQWQPYAAAVRSDALRLISTEGLAGLELSILLTGDDAIRLLNRDFRGKDRPTDVLSFPQFEDVRAVAAGAAGTPIGDVVISIDTARRQAERAGIEPDERIRALLIHGFLHLLGYDHERSPAEARRMFARERELAASLAGAHGITGATSPRASRPRKRVVRR